MVAYVRVSIPWLLPHPLWSRPLSNTAKRKPAIGTRHTKHNQPQNCSCQRLTSLWNSKTVSETELVHRDRSQTSTAGRGKERRRRRGGKRERERERWGGLAMEEGTTGRKVTRAYEQLFLDAQRLQSLWSAERAARGDKTGLTEEGTGLYVDTTC